MFRLDRNARKNKNLKTKLSKLFSRLKPQEKLLLNQSVSEEAKPHKLKLKAF